MKQLRILVSLAIVLALIGGVRGLSASSISIEKDNYSVTYTDDKGDKTVFFDIKKKYNIKKGDTVGLGHAIDFYNSMISQEGNYNTEYLVQKDFIKKIK